MLARRLPGAGRVLAAKLRDAHPPQRAGPATRTLGGRRTGPRGGAELRRAAAEILSAALDAAQPERLVRGALRRTPGRLSVGAHEWRPGRGRLALLAAGKAASTMARAAERILGEDLGPALVVDTAATVPLETSRRILAGHPVPDARGAAAARAVEAMARSLGKGDLLLVLLSGGASALLPAPAGDLRLADKAAVTRALLRAGAPIAELNAVRKHLSRLKGGGLARLASPARVECLALSDVVGDDLSTIASGPTVPDPTTYADALDVLARRGVIVRIPARALRHLEAGAAGRLSETPKPGDALFRRVRTQVLGSNRRSLEAAARRARRLGLRPVVLTSRLEGEARDAARVLVSVLRECVETGRPARAPVCLIAGGETTVTVRGDGHGGRNQELVVAGVEPLAGVPGAAVLASLATDGIDGRSEAAGGVADTTSLARAAALGLAPPASFLAASDSRGFLAPLGDLIVTGPSGTNVNDITILLARGRGRP